MSDINDLSKIFQKASEILDDMGRKAKGMKGPMDSATKGVKTFADALSEVSENAEEAESQVDKLNQAVSKTNYSKFTKGTKEVKNYTKEIGAATESLKEYYLSVDETYKVQKFLNIENNSQIESLKDLTKGVDTLNASLTKEQRKLNEVVKLTSELPANFDKLKKSLAGGAKSGSFATKLKDSLYDLQGAALDSSSFDTFRDSLEQLDNTDLDKLPQAIEDVMKKFSDVKLGGGLEGQSAEIGKKIKQSLLESFSDVKNSVTGDTKDIVESLNTITKLDVFSNLEKESQDSLKKFISDLISGKATLSEIEDHLKVFTELARTAEYSLGDVVSKVSRDVVDTTKKAQDQFDKFIKLVETPKSLVISLKRESSGAQDKIDAIKNKRGATGNISKSEEETLEKLMLQKKEIDAQIPLAEQLYDGSVKLGGTEQEISLTQSEITKKIRATIKESKINNALAERHLKTIEKIENTGYGEEKIQAVSDKFDTASVLLGNFKKNLEESGKTGVTSKLAGGFSNIAQTIGDGMMKYKGLLGALTATIGIIDTIVSYDVKIKKMFKNVADSGVLVGVSADNMGKELSAAFNQSNNINGLLSAVKGTTGALVQGKEEILGIAGALTSSGVSMRELQKQAKNTTGYIEGTSNALVTAAETTHVFASRLGKSDAEMGAMIGDLSFQYSSNLNSIQEGFSDVATAAQNSSMGANKFMSVVQAATAGMALYEDQIIDTAKSLAKMQGTGLTGKEQGTVAKTSAEFVKDQNKVLKAFGLLLSKGGAGLEKIADTMSAKAAELKALADKEAPGDKKIQLEQEAANTSDIAKNLKAGAGGNTKALLEAAALFKSSSVEAAQDLVGQVSDVFKDASKGNTFLYNDLMRQAELGEVGDINVKTRGLAGQVLQGTAKGQGADLGPNMGYEGHKEITAKQDQLTMSSMGKLIDAMKDKFLGVMGPWTGLFVGMLAILASIQTAILAGKILGTDGGPVADATRKGAASTLKGIGGLASKMLGGLGAIFAGWQIGTQIGDAINESPFGKWMLQQSGAPDSAEKNKADIDQMTEHQMMWKKREMFVDRNKKRKEEGKAEYKSIDEMDKDIEEKRARIHEQKIWNSGKNSPADTLASTNLVPRSAISDLATSPDSKNTSGKSVGAVLQKKEVLKDQGVDKSMTVVNNLYGLTMKELPGVIVQTLEQHASNTARK